MYRILYGTAEKPTSNYLVNKQHVASLENLQAIHLSSTRLEVVKEEDHFYPFLFNNKDNALYEYRQRRSKLRVV